MMTHSSAVFSSLQASAKFAFEAAPLPYEAGTTPHNSLIGGGALWVLKGHKPEEYKGVAAFLAHLTNPDQQAKWHKDTGYMPITKAAYEKVKAEGYYDKYPQQEVAITQVQRGTPTLNTMTVRWATPTSTSPPSKRKWRPSGQQEDGTAGDGRRRAPGQRDPAPFSNASAATEVPRPGNGSTS